MQLPFSSVMRFSATVTMSMLSIFIVEITKKSMCTRRLYKHQYQDISLDTGILLRKKLQYLVSSIIA